MTTHAGRQHNDSRVALGVVLAIAALSCSPTRPDPAPAGPSALPTRIRTGTVVAIDRDTLLFVLPGRALWTARLTSDTRFENGTLSGVEGIAAANLAGYAVDATIEGVELGSQQVLAITIAASPASTAAEFLPVGPRGILVVGEEQGAPLLLYPGGKWHYIVTAWTGFDPTGDYTSVTAIVAADHAGEQVWIEGEGARIGQQLTLFRRARAVQGPVS